jgi:hypothetical protein
MYLRRLNTTDLKWLDDDLNKILNGIIDFLEDLK